MLFEQRGNELCNRANRFAPARVRKEPDTFGLDYEDRVRPGCYQREGGHPNEPENSRFMKRHPSVQVCGFALAFSSAPLFSLTSLFPPFLLPFCEKIFIIVTDDMDY